MLSQDRLVPSPAACLSEEAMDLICSFVRECEDDRQMASTLCALSLTSRRWTSSAVRALFFDPTRSLSRNDTVQACWLLSAKLLKSPGLGAYVRELQRLPIKQEYLYDHRDALIETWTLALLRACPNITTLSIPAGGPVTWSTELARLPRLQHLIIEPYCAEVEPLWLDELGAFFSQLKVGTIKRLSLMYLSDDMGQSPPQQYVEVQVDSLELVDYDFTTPCELPIHVGGLKHLDLKPGSGTAGPGDSLLQPTLLTLDYQPTCIRRSPPSTLESYITHAFSMNPSPIGTLPVLPVLHRLSLEYILVDLDLFANIARNCPLLRDFSLKDSMWVPGEWAGHLDPSSTPVVTFNQALAAMPSLATLVLGNVPVYTYGALYAIKESCGRRGVKLVFKPALDHDSASRRAELAARAFMSPQVEDQYYELDRHSFRLNDDFPSPSPFPRSDWPLLPPPFLPPTGVPSSSSSSFEVGDDSGFFEPTNGLYLVPPLSTAFPATDLDSLFSLAFPFSAVSPSSTPNPSRSPSPIFLPAPPDVPRFEPNYQALDSGEKSQDDFDSSDGDEWRRWEGICEIEEADKGWKEGEGSTFEPIEGARKDDEVEVELRDELDEAAVEATIEVWRAVEVCAT